MTTSELAIKYGVPLLETCRELDWKDETRLYWIYPKTRYGTKDIDFKNAVERKKFILSIWYPVRNNTFIDIENEDKEYYDSLMYHFVAAPQMHEIEPLLPIPYSITKGTTTIGFDFLIYPNTIKTILESNNIAEAYAQLYLQLREKGLL